MAMNATLRLFALFADPEDPGYLVPGLLFVNREGFTTYIPAGSFSYVDAEGNDCNEGSQSAKAAPVAPPAPVQIPVSNSADSLTISCDGRFAIVVGHRQEPTSVPVSLVDLAALVEVDTILLPGAGIFAAACDDGESVLITSNDASNETTSVRRLKIAGAKLVDTGEIVRIPGDEPNRIFNKVYAVPGSKVGVALGFRGAGLTTFSIPGLKVLDTTPAIHGFGSAAVSCAGDKVFVRYSRTRPGGIFYDEIDGYSLDPITGALGDTPFLTFDVAYHAQASDTFGDTLALSRDGTRLIVSEIAVDGSPVSPPTSRVSFFDTTTGERDGFFFDGPKVEGAYPTLVSVSSCCLGTGLRLDIQWLASGLVQITATGEINTKYELQKSFNLVAWDNLVEFQMSASPFAYTDPESPTNSSRFYRLKLGQ